MGPFGVADRAVRGRQGAANACFARERSSVVFRRWWRGVSPIPPAPVGASVGGCAAECFRVPALLVLTATVCNYYVYF